MLYKWPQYHFSMVFMMVFIDFLGLLVCRKNIFRNINRYDVDWRQFNVKMIENMQNRQFLSSKWPQYHFLMVFMVVYIDSCSLLVCQMNIYWDSTVIEVNWSKFNDKNDKICAKSSNFVMWMATIPLFNGFHNGLNWFLQSVSVSDEYLLW